MEYIYILRSFTREKTLLKFGYTADIWNSLSQYKSSNLGIEIVYIAQLENALEIEQAFHKQNQSAHGNEWYDEDKLETMMGYIKNVFNGDYIIKDKSDELTTDSFGYLNPMCLVFGR